MSNGINYQRFNNWSNFCASVACYVIMPLTPFMFEYAYSEPVHHITERSIIIALSTYSFSLAFGTKFRVLAVFNIIVGFLAGGLYGSIDEQSIAHPNSICAYVIYFMTCLALVERYHRHINENEECWLYIIFNQFKKE